MPADGDPAVGLELSGDLLLVAGGPSGEARAYDVDNGRLARAVQLAPEGEAFINDIAVLGTTAYATDSQNARLFAVPLRGRDAGTAREVPLSGDFALAQGFNANGIVAYRGQLVVAQTADPVDGEGSALYVVDPATGVADRIEIRGGDVENADGLVVRGDLLAVVQNQSDSIAVLRLSADGTSARLLTELTDDDLAVPTTADLGPGDALYAVNARFGTPPSDDVVYEVVRVETR